MMCNLLLSVETWYFIRTIKTKVKADIERENVKPKVAMFAVSRMRFTKFSN